MLRSLVAAVALAAGGGALAVDLDEGRFTLHGDGEWAWRKTSNENGVLSATPGGSYDSAMLDLVVTARPAESFVVSAQLGFDAEEVSAEWVFAEWRLSDLARLRVGKVHQPFGNSAELRFVGTARPFFDLPNSVYGPAGVVGEAYKGVGLTGHVQPSPALGLDYDLYFGALDLAELGTRQGMVGLADGLAPARVLEHQARQLVGGRLSLSVRDDLVFRASACGGSLYHEAERLGRYLAVGLSTQYRGERLWLSLEGFSVREGDDERVWTGYAQAAWFLTEAVQVAARYEVTRVELTGVPASDPLLRHDEWAVGLNYWVNPGFVFKASYHGVTGNRFAVPAEAALDALAAAAPENRTGVVLFGAQFAF